jgi:SAM-dependent methyltransferase
MTIQEQFGQIDIYLFDQLLRGNILPGMRLVDAGCGSGRNLVYLLRQGYEVFGVDANPAAVAQVREMAAFISPTVQSGNFQVAAVESMPFPDAFADVVVCNSVLHFARDETHFDAMVRELWRVLRPGGMLFCRLGSTIGMDFQPLGRRRFLMPDGQAWFLVDETLLMGLTRTLAGQLVDPLKTTVVQGLRCMTTWAVRKTRV